MLITRDRKIQPDIHHVGGMESQVGGVQGLDANPGLPLMFKELN